MKSKEIIFIGGNLYPYKIGGFEIFNYYFSQKLRKYYSVKYLSHYPKPDYYSDQEYIKIPGIKPLGIFSPLLYFLKLIFNRDKKKIVVLTYTRSKWINWWPYPLLHKLNGLKYVIIIHGGGIAAWKWNLPHKMLFKKASCIIGISERICKEYSIRTKNQITYLPPLCPLKKFSRSKNQARTEWDFQKEDKILLWVGSLKKIKNPDTIIKSALQLGENYLLSNKVLFVIAGDGPLKYELEEKISIGKLDKHFLFLGNVGREKIPALYAAADAYLIASDFEGTPLSLLEAMFNKLFIIASNAPGINTIINDKFNGYLFKTNDAQELSQKIKNMFNEKGYSKITSNASISYEQRYNYSTMISNYKKIFDEL